jgi:hypothetical protein
MFAVFQIAGITPPTEFNTVDRAGKQATPQDLRKELADLKDARVQMGEANPGTPLIDMQIARLEKELGQSSATGKRGAAATVAGEQAPPGGQYTGISFIDHGVGKWKQNPSLMAYKLQSNSYKFSWLLIPLSVPFVWLLFAWRRRFGAYDHAVFVTYSLGFMTLLYVALVLLGGIGVGTGMLLALGLIVPLVHIYKQVRGAYSLSRFSALWRTAALSLFIFVVLFLYIDLLLLLGAAE